MAQLLNVDGNNIIFMGSSGGGQIVFECASYIENAKAVAINPQIKLKEWSFYAEQFSKITGIQLGGDKWHRDDAIYFLKQNEKHLKILIVNLRSKDDMLQVKHVSDELCIKIKYGINYFSSYNLIIWIYDGDMEPFLPAHSTQEFYCIFFIIEYLAKGSLPENNSLFLLFNEFWNYRYKVEKKCRLEYKTPDMFIAHKCHNESRTVAVWGFGKKFKFVENYLFNIDGQNYYNIRCIIDSNRGISGMEYKGIKIIHPDRIQDWTFFYAIVLPEHN